MSSILHPLPPLQGQRKQFIRPCFPQHIFPVGPVTSGESDDMCIRMSWSTCDMTRVLHAKYVGVDECWTIWTKRAWNYYRNFMTVPFDYLLIWQVTNYVRNRGILTCLSWFLRICDRELHSLKNWELKFSDFFDKRAVRILLDAISCV